MKFFPMVITVLKIMGVFDIFENTVARRVYVAFLFLCLSINSFSWCVTILLHLTDIQRFSRASFYFVTGINTMVKLFRILSKRRDLNRLITSFDEVFLKIEAHINIPEHLSIKSLDNRVQKCLLVSWLGGALLCFTYSLGPVIDGTMSGSFPNIPLKYNSEQGIIEEGLPLKFWWPFDVTTYPTYQLTYAYQVTFLFIHIMYYIIINTILYAVLYHIIHRFKILQYVLKNVIDDSIKKVINKEMEVLSSELKQRDYKWYNTRRTRPLIKMMRKTYSPRTDECIQTRSRSNRRSLSERGRRSWSVGSLKKYLSRFQNSHQDDLIGLYESCDCDRLNHKINIQMQQDIKLYIQYSQCLLSVCSQLEEIIHPIVCADMLSTLLVFCVCTFQLSLPEGHEFMSYIEVICDVGAMTLTLCWLSHELTIQSGLLVGSVFECNWLNAPHSFKTSLLTIMIRAQKPVTLSMGKCGPVNLGTFVSILKVAYSNYAILHDLNNH